MEENNLKELKEEEYKPIIFNQIRIYERMLVNSESLIYKSKSLLEVKNSFYHYFKPNNDEEFKVKINKKTNTIIIYITHFNRRFVERLESHSDDDSCYISEIRIKQKNIKTPYFIEYRSRHSLERYLGRKLKDIEEFTFFIEPRFDTQLNKNPEKLYHLCDKNDVENILQMGLSPKKYPDETLNKKRLYFGLTKNSVKKMKDIFKVNKENTYVILEIETSKIKDLKKENLYILEDREKKIPGVYLIENVPPIAITVLKQNIKFQTNA